MHGRSSAEETSRFHRSTFTFFEREWKEDEEGNAKPGTPPSSINFAAIEISIIDGAENSGLFDFETPSRIISPYISLSVFR